MLCASLELNQMRLLDCSEVLKSTCIVLMQASPVPPEKLFAYRKKMLKEQAAQEQMNSSYNLSKIQESWLKIMRAAKTKRLKKEAEVVSQNHERDVDRKDAILQMLDRDLDEAEEQQQTAVRSCLLHLERLMHIHRAGLDSLDEQFKREVDSLKADFEKEGKDLTLLHQKETKELDVLIEEVELEEKAREQQDITEHQAQYELIRNRNIEEDHQMRSHLEEKIEQMKEKCNAQLTSYRQSTEANTADYKAYLQRDGTLSKHVERKLKQVDKMQTEIQNWKTKLFQNRQECEERNRLLRAEKEQLGKHFQDLKAKMMKFRAEGDQRLADLTTNARRSYSILQGQLKVAEKIVKTAELCRKYETEREKVLPFYLNHEIDVDELPIEDEKVKDEVKAIMSDSGIDEWTYLDNFLKRFNKVHLDTLAVEKEQKRLEKEHFHLKSILRQFLQGVSLNDDVLEAPNPLFVVNGRVNLNHIPLKRGGDPKGRVVVEAAHEAQKRPLEIHKPEF